MPNNINGTNQDDTLNGTPGEDSIRGRGGDDSILAGDADDTVRGDNGNDTIFGGAGDDDLSGQSQDDLIDGGAGNDTIEGDSGEDTLHGGDGDDSILGGSQDDLVTGGAGNDTLDGESGADTLEGGDGDDLILGQSADDQIWGDAGNDTIDGGSSDDLVSGGQGNDSLDGDSGNDSLFGGFGDDTITGGDGNDWMEGGAGDDLIDAGGYSGGADTIVFGPGFGNDTIDGFNPGSDFLHIGGADPNDVIFTATGDPKVWVLTLNGVPGDSLTLDFGFYWDSNVQVTQLVDRVLTNDDTPIPEDPYGEPICLTAGALVETRRGVIPAAMLLQGDSLRTLDDGWQPLRAVLRRTVTRAEMAADPTLRPVHFARGAFGGGKPTRDMTVSLQHGFLAVDRADPNRETMIRARHLADMLALGTIPDAAPVRSVTYVHVLMDRHHLIRADGVWTETVFTGPRAIAADPLLQSMTAGLTLPDMPGRARPLLTRRDLRGWRDYIIGRRPGQRLRLAA
jgi:hypothetical protein